MRYRSRRAGICLATMIVSVFLLLAGIGLDRVNLAPEQPMATIGLACTAAGLVGGVGAYVYSRFD